MKVFTLGTAGRQHFDFTKILSKYGIQVVFDLRRSPASPQMPQFNRDSLRMLCASQNADYIFLGHDLGGPRDKELKPPSGDFRRGPEPEVRDWLATDEFKRCVAMIADKAGKRATCILCTERLPVDCQRWFLAQALLERKIEVVHILDEAHLWTPPPPSARPPTPNPNRPGREHRPPQRGPRRSHSSRS